MSMREIILFIHSILYIRFANRKSNFRFANVQHNIHIANILRKYFANSFAISEICRIFAAANLRLWGLLIGGRGTDILLGVY